MKNSVFALCFALVLLSMQSFSPYLKSQYFELKEGEKVSFNHLSEVNHKYFSSVSKRASYDGSKYEIELDSSSNLIIKKIQSCPDINQSELEILYSQGSINRINDTLNIEIKTAKSKWYLIPIKKQVEIDSFSSKVYIKILSKDLNDNICRNLVSDYRLIKIIALPAGNPIKEVYKPLHKKNTVGSFSYFKIEDSNGKSKTYTKGDYFMIGANSYKNKY